MLEKILKEELNKKYNKQIAEAKDEPLSLVNTEKIIKDSGKENKEYQKEVGKKMDDYVKDMGNDDFVPPKHNLTDRQDEYIATHRGGNNMQLEYGQEPSDAFKERIAKNVPYGNLEDKGNVYDNIGVKKYKANDTQAKMEKAAKEIEKQKGDIDGYYDETGKNIKYADQPVTKDNKKATEKNNLSRLAFNENKMKKIKYKKEFIDESHAITLIPNSYKVDNHIFEMTDGNLTVKVKWEGDNMEGEGYVLNSKNTAVLSEEMKRMKDLFNYDSGDKFDVKKNIELNEEQYFLGFVDDVNGFKLTSDQVEEEIIDDINVEETEEETPDEVVTEGGRVIGTGDTGESDEDGAPESEKGLKKFDKDLDEDCELEEGCGEIEEDSEGKETYNYGEDEGEDRKEEEDLEDEERMAPEDHIKAIEDHLDALKDDMDYDEDHEDRDEEGTDFREETLKEWCKSNDLLSENGNVTLSCIEKAKLSENIVISKKSLIAENIIKEKKESLLKEDDDWMQGAEDDIEKRGTEGVFHKFCVDHGYEDGCSKGCWDRAREEGGVWGRRAGLAKAFCESKH